MFAKLLKHEWKATWGILGVLSLCALGAGVVGALMLRLLVAAAENNQSNPLTAISPTLLLFVILGLFVYSVGSSFLLYFRFYKNKFTDEGYLTFTLPAKSSEIFLASLVNILVWSLIIGLVVCVSVGLILVLGLGDLVKNIFPADAWQQLLESVDGEVILNLAMNAVNAASNVVVIMACITLGAVVAKKHKLLVAVGFYYAASTVRNTVSTVLLASTMNNTQTFEKVMTVSSVSNAVIGVLFAVGGYFLSVYLMDHKLNLP
jgi:hypothetical protein